MRMAGVKKIFLAQVTKFRVKVGGDVHMVVDHEANVRASGNGRIFSAMARISAGDDFLARSWIKSLPPSQSCCATTSGARPDK